MNLFVHTPELTEVGHFGYDDLLGGALREIEARIASEHAIATTIPLQSLAEASLAEGGWQVVGHRYNQFHGPNFIKLWYKHFGRTGAVPTAVHPGEAYMYQDGPPWSHFCCGLWIRHHAWNAVHPQYKATKWLAVWQLVATPEQAAELRASGWRQLGANLWHTAEPLENRETYGGGDSVINGISWQRRDGRGSNVQAYATKTHGIIV